jgi:hypothetical protein
MKRALLQDAYDQLARLLPEVEPFEALEAELHRWFWRPAGVRVVLLAESHVFTSPSDLQRSIVRLPGAPAGIPPGFVRRGAPGRTRTADAGLRTASLCPLSYGGAPADRTPRGRELDPM